MPKLVRVIVGIIFILVYIEIAVFITVKFTMPKHPNPEWMHPRFIIYTPYKSDDPYKNDCRNNDCWWLELDI